MGARVYDPSTGTFTQPDPVIGGGATPYGYTNGDPVNETDLDGEFAVAGRPRKIAAACLAAWCLGQGTLPSGGKPPNPHEQHAPPQPGQVQNPDGDGNTDWGKYPPTHQPQDAASKSVLTGTTGANGPTRALNLPPTAPGSFGDPNIFPHNNLGDQILNSIGGFFSNLGSSHPTPGLPPPGPVVAPV
jgi:hypothetical protein